MKKIWLFMLVAAVTASCKDNPTTEPDPDPGSADITITESSAGVYTLSAGNLPTGVTPTWNTGDGRELTGNNITAKYPAKGTYTVSMSYIENYATTTKTKELKVENNNTSLITIPAALLADLAGTSSKTWVLDSLTSAHIGTGQADITTPGDWTAKPEEKAGTGMYQQKMTFKTDFGFTLVNNGFTIGAGRAAEAEMVARGATPRADNPTDQWTDRFYDYTVGNDWIWQFVTQGDKNYIYFAPKTGFMIYFRPAYQFYEITKLTADELHVRQESVTYTGDKDNVALYMKFIREGFAHEVLPEVVSVDEDFEVAAELDDFFKALKLDNMGDETSFSADNPAPGGINTSSKVALYQKSENNYCRLLYGNVNEDKEWTDKLDLSEFNKFSMKVFFPSEGNDYETQTEVDPDIDWSDGRLKKKVTVRLLNNAAAKPWEGENRLELSWGGYGVDDRFEVDKWIEVKFDFSEAAARTDFDTIVIQFGDEGHHATGKFYFDDFKYYGGGR